MEVVKPIIVSRLRWYVIPVFAVALFCVGLIVFDLATGAEFLTSLSSARRGGRFIGWLLAAPIAAVGILWYIRRVKVYPDRIEVKYPLHKSWNSVISIKDVDCYCLEHQEIEENDNYDINKRIYLLTGRKLWLYISDNDCSNYDKMLDVLDNYFKIPMRDGIINLSKEDMKTVKHGGCIELEDISDEELAALKENRLRRPTVNRLSSAL